MTDQNKPVPKVPPRPVRNVGASGSWSSSTPSPLSGTADSAPGARPQAAPPASAAPSSQPPSSSPAPAHQVTQVAPSQPPASSGAHGAGLKVVTISPGSISFPDVEEVTSSRLKALRQDPYLGATIDGRYKVEALLGEGGMGVVYRCVHTIIGKKVAMKVLRADLARDAEVTERFLNEAKSASTIGNAHIIDISDFGQFQDGSTYFVMEFLVGQPLTKIVEGGQAVPVPRILNIARQLAEGLSAAHAASIVHRDLKPDNIFLIDRGGEKDFVKILDFGIAKVSTAGEGAKLTRAGAVFGTPHYMSPEQAAGQPVDHRGDVYSFGVILYEMASGRVPFDADNFMGILTQHMYKAPVPIRALVPQPQEVPPGLEAIVLKCLSKRPEHRYQSMDELIADLDKLKAGSVPSAVPEMMSRSGGFNVPADYFAKPQMPEPVPASPQSKPGKSKWPLLAGLAGVVAAVAIVGGIFAKSSQSGAQPSAAVASKPEPARPASSVAVTTPPDTSPLSKQVALAVVPPEAHVFDGDKDLGTSPVLLAVEDGKTVNLSVRMDGYKDLSLSLDGSKPRESVKLERLPAKAGYVARPQPKKTPEPPKVDPKKKKSGMGGGEIVNPWD
jgi:eukaryotic-like serine/threonine-protein kinase